MTLEEDFQRVSALSFDELVPSVTPEFCRDFFDPNLLNGNTRVLLEDIAVKQGGIALENNRVSAEILRLVELRQRDGMLHLTRRRTDIANFFFFQHPYLRHRDSFVISPDGSFSLEKESELNPFFARKSRKQIALAIQNHSGIRQIRADNIQASSTPPLDNLTEEGNCYTVDGVLKVEAPTGKRLQNLLHDVRQCLGHMIDNAVDGIVHDRVM